MNNDADPHYLREALEQAKIRRGFCAPNPSVGCVIVRNNEVIATGYHLAAGQPHAEVDALQKINFDATDATIYVTLEPCSHVGKTPACTDAIIKSKANRVVFGYQDPNPIVSGNGEKLLLAANIACELLPLPEIAAFYESYTHWQQTHKPFVTGKLAISLDGKIASKDGKPLEITSKALKEFTHTCRRTSDAILTTAQTIIQDNPQLNVRQHHQIVAKPVYILDSQLKTPTHAQIFQTALSVTIFHAPNASVKHQHALEALGARCLPVETSQKGLNLVQVVELIGKDGIHDLWVEAGGECFTAFTQESLFQRSLIYIAPWAVGEGIPAFPALVDFRHRKIHWQQYGQDVLCEIRMP